MLTVIKRKPITDEVRLLPYVKLSARTPSVLSAGKKVLWEPNSYAQEDFVVSKEFEAFLGGAKGGGKSAALVSMSTRYVHKAKYKAIIFRRTYPRLRELTDRARDMYPKLGGQGKNNNTEWIFPSGAQIIFAHLQHDKDVDNYQGQQYQFIGFDEVTQFTRDQYITMLSCCRSPDPSVPCYIRATGNPGGAGHVWVKERFIDSCKPIHVGPPVHNTGFDVLWQPQKAGTALSDGGLTRRFYPAKVFDNLDLLASSPAYVLVLKNLPENLRKAYLDGDWESFQGQFFAGWSEVLHVKKPWIAQPDNPEIDQWGIPKSYLRIGSIDWGVARPWSAGEACIHPDTGRVSIYRTITEPGWDHERQAKWCLAGAPGVTWVADDACFNKPNTADLKIKQVTDVELWRNYGLHNVIRAEKGFRIPGWRHLIEFLKPMANDPTIAGLEIWDVPGARGPYGIITVMPKMIHDPDNPEDMLSECPDEARDDAPDMLRMMLLHRPVPKAMPEKSKRPYAVGDYFANKPVQEDEMPEGTIVGNW